MKKRNLTSLKLNKSIISKMNSLHVQGGVPGKPPAAPAPRKTKYTECRVKCYN